LTPGVAVREAKLDGGWFVVWTASRAEKRVASRISALGIDAWLPTLTEKRRWSDRWREVITPLFPGYLFARATHVNWPQLLRTVGVITVVRDGDRPALLTDGFIKSLRNAVNRATAPIERLKERAEYEIGDQVVVEDGILAGVRGVVRQRRGYRQLMIWVPEIGGGVAVTIGTAAVIHDITEGRGLTYVSDSQPRMMHG